MRELLETVGVVLVGGSIGMLVFMAGFYFGVIRRG